ncbi:MAG: hypothetical protein AB1500_07330 [Bacillota bacterium]
MTTKAATVFVMKTAILSFHFVMFNSLAAKLTGLAGAAKDADADGAAVMAVVQAVLVTLVLSYAVIRSRWSGWRLAVTVFVVYYGISTFLSQIESVVFLKYLVDIIPAEMLPKLFAQGAVVAALFAPMIVLFWRRKKGTEPASEPNGRLVMPPAEWAWKLLLAAVIYIAVYISFGALVFMPLAGEAFQEYYAGLETPWWIIPFQGLRGLIWIALALPVIRMMKGRWWEAGLAVSLLFSVLMGSLLLIPTEIMPDRIRLAHLVEVSSSNFLFGWVVVLLFRRRQARAAAAA